MTRAAFARITDELQAIRASIDGFGERLGTLANENAALRTRLEHSESARADLLAQTERILELLADARRELRERPAGRSV